jgi:hypothetical protein
MSAPPYVRTWRTKWLGAPNTAANTVPGTAGLDVSNLAPVLIKGSIRSTPTAIDCAVVGLLKDKTWWAGSGANIQAAVTVDTTDAQSAAANDFPLEVANQANSGCMFGGPVPFGALSIATTTNSAGSPVRVLEYWNGAWTTIAAAGLLVAPPANWLTTATEDLVLFVPPNDWVVGGTPVDTVNQTTFNLRIRSTTAPTTAGSAGRVYLGVVFDGRKALAANSTWDVAWDNIQGWPCPNAVAAISGAANVANEGHVISIVYR